MDFGRVEPQLLNGIDFTLAPDSRLTSDVLKNADPVSVPDVYIGCAKWGIKEWTGLIYPVKTREAMFLDEYVKHFNSIELNAVFYRMPKKEQISVWREKAEKERNDFKFFPKVTRRISHLKRLKDVKELTTLYLENISAFGDTLGAVFLQLSDNFGPKNFKILKNYLESLPPGFNIFVEVRHPGWFSNQAAGNELFEMLRELKKGSVITDAAGRRDCVHMELSIPEAFIRFVGNGLHPTDYARIDQWVDRIADWKARGLRAVYFFLHQHDEKNTPLLADYTVKKINEKIGMDLGRPQFVNKQQELH